VSRAQIIALSVGNVALGATTVFGHGTARGTAGLIGLFLGVVLAFISYDDLRTRGWGWPAALIAAWSVLMTAVGLVLYVLASRRPKLT
jgi:hypothetical protein